MQEKLLRPEPRPRVVPATFNHVTLAQVAANPYVDAYIRRADECLATLGYTEHGLRHANLTAKIARNILTRLDAPVHDRELAAIAGYLHDMGNLVNRNVHAETGAAIVHSLLYNMNCDPDELAVILGAIGNHDEHDGTPVSNVAAAVIIADKTDVHRTRVRNPNTTAFDVHDRVNYATVRSFLRVLDDHRTITLELEVDNTISTTMEYFEIFMSRMVMCRKAADFMGCQFKLTINQIPVM